jgi:phosphomethylpyrimidine synthase
MKITQDVRDYADGLSDNEKQALYPADAEAGMAEMSEKFKELGGQIYLSADGSVREDID